MKPIVTPFAPITPPTHFAPFAPALALTLALAGLPVLAQTPPDAGHLLQQERPTPDLPPAAAHPSSLAVEPPATTAPGYSGGATVALKTIRFEGNTVFDVAQLANVLGDIGGRRFDLAGLHALARAISDHYRRNGYPFARAWLREQTFANGELTISVLEGRYGAVRAEGEPQLAALAQSFLAELRPGEVIEAGALERATLLLDDLPGLRVAPLLRPGSEPGTGDLVVAVSPAPTFRGELGADNHGNRYTGEYRARLQLTADNPLGLGDQFTLRTLASDEGQWLGQLGYSLPLGAAGLRGQVGYARTYYQLAGQFANLDATGTADIASLGLTWPLVRSRNANWTFSAHYQHKHLLDKQNALATQSGKRSRSWPLALQFDHRDGLGGGGITYGSASLTLGNLDLDAAQRAADAASARTQGHFRRWNLDLARAQATPIQHLTLHGRLSAQWASKNLDSSEDFGLGGPAGVRAYPGGEGFGDEGWVVQIEARYQMGAFAPYAFHDAGRVTINRNPWAAGENHRRIAGTGVGLRYDEGPWRLDASLAWRSHGGTPTSDPVDRQPRLWASLAWRF